MCIENVCPTKNGRKSNNNYYLTYNVRTYSNDLNAVIQCEKIRTFYKIRLYRVIDMFNIFCKILEISIEAYTFVDFNVIEFVVHVMRI